MRRTALYLSLLLLLSFEHAVAQQNSNKTNLSERPKIAFIAGGDSHGKGEHEYNGGTTFLARKLQEGMPDLDTVVCHYGWPKDNTVLKGVSTIVVYCDGSEGHMLAPHFAELDSMMNKGVGIVMIHFTLEIPKGSGGDKFLDLVGGYYETNWSVNPVWTPEFSKLPNHLITNGVKPFRIKDEWYFHLRFPEGMKNITPILKVLPPQSTLERPEGTHSNNAYVREDVLVKKLPQTLAWAYERPGGGRGFGYTGGHIHANWKDDNIRMLLLNAIAWTAHLTVPKEGIRTTTPSSEELNRLTKQTK